MEKYLFRPFLMPLQIFLYRLTGGRIGGAGKGLKLLLLTTTGRKSGVKHTTPAGYLTYENGYVIAGTNAGMPRNPGWYYNLKTDPRPTIQVNDRVMAVVAEEATGDLRGQLWERLIEQAPSYADYSKRTDREFPMVILRPVVQA
jgi:deazaflavin-dependent oxidoreductase (nitroreductase family)